MVEQRCWAHVAQYPACPLYHCSRSRCSSCSCILAMPCSISLRSPTRSCHPSKTMNRSTCTGLCLALARGTRRTHAFLAARLLPSMWPCAAAGCRPASRVHRHGTSGYRRATTTAAAADVCMYVGCCCCCCCAAVLAETYSYGTVRTAQYFLAAILSRFGGIIDSAQYCTVAFI